MNFRSRIPESFFVEGFSTCFNDGMVAVHASVERVAVFTDSLCSGASKSIPRIVMEDFQVENVDLLRVYSVDNCHSLRKVGNCREKVS